MAKALTLILVLLVPAAPVAVGDEGAPPCCPSDHELMAAPHGGGCAGGECCIQPAPAVPVQAATNAERTSVVDLATMPVETSASAHLPVASLEVSAPRPSELPPKTPPLVLLC